MYKIDMFISSDLLILADIGTRSSSGQCLGTNVIFDIYQGSVLNIFEKF